ncbi:hypothetical protein [Arcticibacter sp. MXS-1]|uniref:hypothetical protein n=1 Tax=Arcticibacter sp. MXS-1 TaxID=3341726 RepID=UPI0035A93A8E
MKRLLLPAFASVSLLIAACSTTNQLAQQGNNDDVYASNARAKEVDYSRQPERSYRTDEQLYGGGDYRDDVDYDFDYGYAARLNRFQYASPWRSYYDNWYTYSYDPWMSYRYDPYFYGSGLSMSFNYGFGGYPFYSSYYSPWGIYGYGYSPYGNYWGPVSYYGGGYYPGYGYGYGGGYYGGGVVVADRNYRPRPTRNTGNPNYGRGGYSRPGATGNPNAYGRPADGRVSSGGNYGGRPVRGDNGYPGASTSAERPVRQERPARQERPSGQDYSRPSRSERPERSSYPTYTPSTSSSSGSGSSGSSGGSSGYRPRPSR